MMTSSVPGIGQAPQISDEMATTAARAEYEDMTKDFGGDPSWAEVDATFRQCMVSMARLQLAAAYPLIEAEVRQKVADEIDAFADRHQSSHEQHKLEDYGSANYQKALRKAAGIARGAS